MQYPESKQLKKNLNIDLFLTKKVNRATVVDIFENYADYGYDTLKKMKIAIMRIIHPDMRGG